MIHGKHIAKETIGPEHLIGRGAPLRVGASYGNTFWVDSAHDNAADDDARGGKTQPFATLAYAVGSARLTAGQDDTLIVAPGHSEVVATAAAINLAKTGTRIVGLGYGTLMPKLTFTADAADLKISAADCSIQGICFECDKTTGSHVRMINIAAAWAVIQHCRFQEGATTEQSLANIVLSDAAADFCGIYNNRFISLTDNGDHAIAIDAVVDGLEVIGNWINGDYDDACIHSASAHLNCLIRDNYLRNMAATFSLEFSAAATGIVARNAYINSLTQAQGQDTGSCFSIENYHCDAVDVSGIISPVIT